jgi:hypothetical protein
VFVFVRQNAAKIDLPPLQTNRLAMARDLPSVFQVHPIGGMRHDPVHVLPPSQSVLSSTQVMQLLSFPPEVWMPEKKTLERARKDARKGKAPTTQAGEFVKEEIDHIRQGKHGARSTKQAIAIGLSKARRAGVKLPPPKAGKTSSATRQKAERDYERGQSGQRKRPSAKRSRSRLTALKKERRSVVSKSALSKQARSAARNRTRAAGR